MSSIKEYVTIKGNKDGLVFILNDECDYEDLIKDLKYKIERSHQKFLTGATMQVVIEVGNRAMDPQKEEEIRNIITKHENLQINEISPPRSLPALPKQLKVVTGMIRSGQTVEYDSDVLWLGDINPGGVLSSSGSLFIMGALRGVAHAGNEGNDQAVIAASYMQPTQLRIADVISRPPDEWDFRETNMEFAYLKDGVMKIDRISQLQHVRPELGEEGE